MAMLTLGVLLWAIVHLFPSLTPGVRSRLIEKVGEGPYKGLFAVDIVLAVLLMVFGWRSVPMEMWYSPPLQSTPAIAAVLVLVAFVLMGAANAPTNVKRVLRHPMLTGVIVWGGAHLLVNGDNRSVVLFGGLIIWAVIAIVSISKREGEWTKPGAVPLSGDIILVVVGALLTAVVAYFHEYLSGVAILGL